MRIVRSLMGAHFPVLARTQVPINAAAKLARLGLASGLGCQESEGVALDSHGKRLGGGDAGRG